MLTDAVVHVADYASVEGLFDKHHDLERLGRKIAEMYFVLKEEKRCKWLLECI